MSDNLIGDAERFGDPAFQALAAAGPRSRLPAARVESVRQAARQAWQDGLRRRRRRTIYQFGGALTALLLVAVGLVTWSPGRPPTAQARVAKIGGELVIDGRAAALDAPVLLGSRLETRGGTAALALSRGESLRLDDGSEVELSGERRVLLRRGALYFDSASAAELPGFEIATAFGVVRDVGTQFEVRLEPAAGVRVRVRTGRVELAHERGVATAAAGEELHLAHDQVSRQTIPAVGPHWAWSEKAAPPWDADGRTLAEMLAWVERETGLTWRFADPELAAQAQHIVLHGDVADLAPEQALEVMLPGCKLRHRRDGVVLVLERMP